MKKLMISLSALLLVLVLCFAVMAENSTPATELYDSVTKLLFANDNVTLTGAVKFSLDGVWFKTADIILKQDGNRSYRELALSGTRQDGTAQKNGYRIVTDGSSLYLMENVRSGIYRSGTTAEHTSLIRGSRETEQLISLGRAFVANADLLLGKDILTETPEGDLCFEFRDTESVMLNAVVNQVYQFAAKRYFENDYDSYAADRQSRIEDYVTVTEGILHTAKSVSVKQALVNVKRDENGLPKYMEGEITLNLETAGRGERQIDISFQMNVKDQDKTKVKRFDPKEYDVISEREMAEAEPMYIDESDLNATERAALRALYLAGFDRNNIVYMGYQRMENGSGEVSFGGAEGWEETFLITADGKVTAMDMDSAEWKNGSDDQFTKEPQPDAETDGKVKAFLTEFLQEVNPDLVKTVDGLKAEWMYKRYDHVYVKYTGEDATEFVVRIEPEMRAEAMSLPGAMTNEE
ncbi:MAG: hypothetical protein J6Y48_05450 [Clostridia bacterium]|nr:hypothetical protein [Clostridia bacterium]